tara:strand:+ start:94 stop:522 length:429 start_codon:yes stop_codon:yes gene_type:complete
MPSSPIAKKLDTLPDNWVHLQKTMIPDTETSCYWSVWYDIDDEHENTAWLMWCPFGEDPSVNDSWGHVEDLDGDCMLDALIYHIHHMNVLTAIEAVYGVDFKDSMWFPMTAVEGTHAGWENSPANDATEVPSLEEIRKSCGE